MFLRALRLSRFTLTMLGLHSLLYVVIGFDIPILRQIVGFTYFVFTPGLLLLKVIKLGVISKTDTILLSSGLSISLLMFVGLAVNFILPLLGFMRPLSTWPLLVSISAIALGLLAISLGRDKSSSYQKTSVPSGFAQQILLLAFVSFLSVTGSWLNNRYFLLMAIVLIAGIVASCVFFEKPFPARSYPFVVFVIAVSLMFHWQLVSPHLMGWDVFPEYYVFKLTESRSLWNPGAFFSEGLQTTDLYNYNSMLSVTILPTMFSNLLKIDAEWTFKAVFPLIFSLVPVALYQAWKGLTTARVAFLSSFCFMMLPLFYDMSEMRRMIAELFLALIVLLMANRELDSRKRRTLVMGFGAAIVASHYSLGYILMALYCFAWICTTVMRKKTVLFSRIANVNVVVVFLAVSALWHMYVSLSPAITLSGFVRGVLTSVHGEFFSLEARGGPIYSFIFVGSAPSYLHVVDNVVSKSLYVFLFLGVTDYLRRLIKDSEMESQWEYGLMTIGSISILCMNILLPYFGPGFVTERFFHITLFFLAPLFVSGGKMFFGLGLKLMRISARADVPANKQLLSLVCIALIAIFLFKVGFVYEIAGDVPSSISLSGYRMKISTYSEVRAIWYSFYIPEQDVSNAKWLSAFQDKTFRIYGDLTSLYTVESQGAIYPGRFHFLYPESAIEPGAYIYLRSFNVEGVFRYINYSVQRPFYVNLSQFSRELGTTNVICANGYGLVRHTGVYAKANVSVNIISSEGSCQPDLIDMTEVLPIAHTLSCRNLRSQGHDCSLMFHCVGILGRDRD